MVEFVALFYLLNSKNEEKLPWALTLGSWDGQWSNLEHLAELGVIQCILNIFCSSRR